ncbi:hypothetical protein LTR10_013578 [Elasticomyces elasticus]|uniref:Uncharacterized protein n=1 Tax=Exophiala sideris TaxID=1016849 RepID=A0ABR0JQ54_9EURO|nr:hypothetical protein LTR10_013578 [Elasticomyces elasticus]KAK5039716.1 hypothetical protein LTS07_000211 [Exophiala sideris]KAK5041268.1 hypothetical protein LTR13_002743 [Exophiala sideris]KAK5068094.1 hypothetical protein LTR69_000212 [Exophiala sideris]KAK5187395.1 hypothetical protein LTR44_000211 [Eurotiomycetes sp. CCFEE 6388]
MMAQARNRRQASDELSAFTIDDCTSVNSGDPVNQPFFSKTKQPLPPSHTASTTWKSNNVKEQEEFDRVKQRVKHIAPEQFKAHAKPGKGPSGIFPQNVTEWTQHKKEILALAQAEQQKNLELLKGQISSRAKIPKHQRKIKSVFGVDGKIFKDGRSPVLAMPSIWSAEYQQTTADWPTVAELKWNGDSRECKLARTKCGRYLPPPRDPSDESLTWHDQPFLRARSLDQTGPVYTAGPRPDEVYEANDDMNNDPAFEKLGNLFLGADLMQELGEWRPVCVPTWWQEQPGMRGTPSIVVSQFEHEHTSCGSSASPPEAHVEVMATPDFGIIGGHLRR